jgi:hypothetical protein
MPERAALQAAENQLAYSRKECAAAEAANDAARLAQCERFIAQCELMVNVLRDIAKQK